MNLITYVLIITIIFIIWSEYSVTNILIRENSKGNKSFNLNSLFGFLMDPFHRKTLWTNETLDINYAFVLLYSLGIYCLIRLDLPRAIITMRGQLGLDCRGVRPRKALVIGPTS